MGGRLAPHTLQRSADDAAERAAVHRPPDVERLSAELAPDTLPPDLETATPGAAPAGAVALQRAYGNQFVQRLATGSLLQATSGPVDRAEGGTKGGGVGRAIQRGSASSAGGTVSHKIESRIEGQRGGGDSLPDGTRSSMERSFGADFSNVRVHTGGEATQLNRSLGARAFTTGSDVFFADGEYQPGTDDGNRLLAHELTHVVQQDAAPARPQAKLEVNPADDEFELEADATAQRIVDGGVPAEVEEREETEVSAHRSIQRVEEDDLGETTSAEAVSSSTEGGEQSEEEKQQSEEESRKARAEGELAGRQQGEDNTGAREAEDEMGGAAENAAAMGITNVPELPTQPQQPPAPMETKPTDDIASEQEMAAQAVPEEAQALANDLSAGSVMPPEWEAETALHETFAAMADAGPNASTGDLAESAIPASLKRVQAKAVPFKGYYVDDVRPPPTGSAGALSHAPSNGVQRVGETATAPPAPAPAPSVESSGTPAPPTPGREVSGGDWVMSTPPNYTVPVPAHENMFAQTVIGATAGKAAEAVNSFAGIGKEENAFGQMAALFEGTIQVMELVTNILGYISLVLAILAGIFYGLGAALLGFIFTMGAGLALLAAGAKLSLLLLKIANIVYMITVVRFQLRLAALLFRGLDLLYSLAMGASAAEMKRKLGIIAGQAVGTAVDVFSLAVMGAPAPVDSFTKPGFDVIKQTATTVGAGALTYGLGTGAAAGKGYQEEITSGVGLARDDEGPAADALEPPADSAEALENLDPEVKASAIEAAAPEAGGEGKEVNLPAVPVDAPETIDRLAVKIAGAQSERQFLRQRVQSIDDILLKKQQWNEDLGTGEEELAANQDALNTSDQLIEQQMAAAEEFADKSEEGQGPTREAKGVAGQAIGESGAIKGDMESASKQAESEGAGSNNADKSAADNGPNQGQQGAAQGEGAAVKGVADAQASKAEGQAVKEETESARQQTSTAQEGVRDKRAENTEDMEMLLADKEECLARLMEIDEQEGELRAAHGEAIAFTNDWVSEHRTAREELGEPAMAGAAE